MRVINRTKYVHIKATPGEAALIALAMHNLASQYVNEAEQHRAAQRFLATRCAWDSARLSTAIGEAVDEAQGIARQTRTALPTLVAAVAR